MSNEIIEKCESCDCNNYCNYNRKNKTLDCTINCQKNYIGKGSCYCEEKGYCDKLKKRTEQT